MFKKSTLIFMVLVTAAAPAISAPVLGRLLLRRLQHCLGARLGASRDDDSLVASSTSSKQVPADCAAIGIPFKRQVNPDEFDKM
ncbi:hypothetical protein B0H11DRAFT_2227601 [Mycena galericulata]|nr:hypothetical protein B0H11DRAFT_2227601 [Mycena galericulata]